MAADYAYLDGDFTGSPDDHPPQLAPVIPLRPIETALSAAPIETTRRQWRFTREVPGFGADVQPSAASARRDLAVVGTTQRTGSAPKSTRATSAQGIRQPAEGTRRRLRRLPSDEQWRATMRGLDSAVGYLADPDIYQMLAAARAVSATDATEWLAATQAERARKTSIVGDVPPASAAGPKGGSGISDPTGEAAVSGAPNPDAEVWAILLTIERAAALIITGRSRLSRLAYRRGDAERRARELAEVGINAEDKVGQGLCAACDTWCSGAEDDRLRSGLCNRHATAYYRLPTPRPDRFSWAAGVKRELEESAAAEAERYAARVDARNQQVGRAA